MHVFGVFCTGSFASLSAWAFCTGIQHLFAWLDCCYSAEAEPDKHMLCTRANQQFCCGNNTLSNICDLSTGTSGAR